MHRVILAALLFLAACASPDRSAAFRDSAQPIWSAAAFVPSRASGTWTQVAAFAGREGGCAAGRVDLSPVPDGLQVTGTLCLDGRPVRLDSRANPTGPGRLSLPGQEDWWILWVDEGYRTLAIGTPSGRFGFVLDRAPPAADRLLAAREVFDFNGYDTARFRD